MKEAVRKEMVTFIGELEAMKAKIDTFNDMINSAKDELDTSYDAKSERWQESDKGERARDEIQNFEYLIGYIEDAGTGMESAKEQIEELTKEKEEEYS